MPGGYGTSEGIRIHPLDMGPQGVGTHPTIPRTWNTMGYDQLVGSPPHTGMLSCMLCLSLTLQLKLHQDQRLGPETYCTLLGELTWNFWCVVQ